MAAGDTVLVAAQTKAVYRAQGDGANLIGSAFDAELQYFKSNSDILMQLQGGEGSGKPIIVKRDLEKGAKDKIYFSVGTTLGAAGRRGTQVAVNYEEQTIQSNWFVQIDTLRVVVGYNEITRVVAATGREWPEVYAELVGTRCGQIEQEDMLVRFRQRGVQGFNLIRPGNITTLDGLKYDSTFDTQTLSRAITTLGTNGAKPAMIGKMTGGMPLNRYVCLGSSLMVEPLWNDPTFAAALQQAQLRGDDNPYWTGDIPDWRGTVIKKWEVVNHDNPGSIGSAIQPQALLGDPIADVGGGNAATTADTFFGGGRTQSSLGNSKTLYKPFELFYGCDKLFGETISTGADATVYYFLIIDPADGKWCLYSYTGSTGLINNGNAVTITNRLAHASAGVALTTLGNWTWDGTVNKEVFPTGSLMVQCNANVVPVGDVLVMGAEAGSKAYGMVKDKRIKQLTDYEAQVGLGIRTDYGCDMRQDTLGKYRGFVRVQCAYELSGFSLPQL